MKTYEKVMQTGDGEALCKQLRVILKTGDKLVAVGVANKPGVGVRKFTFETEDE